MSSECPICWLRAQDTWKSPEGLGYTLPQHYKRILENCEHQVELPAIVDLDDYPDQPPLF